MSRRPHTRLSAHTRFPLDRIAVVIPVWQPTDRLLRLVTDLVHAGFRHLVVVDDGSSPEHRPFFAALAAMPEVTLRHHALNQGKGCALKTAFTSILNEAPSLLGVVTADADGQHTPDDIVRVARHLLRSPERVLLGVRALQAGTPWRSRLGNAFTRLLFALFSGRLLQDTQTGLRGLPCSLLPDLLRLPGQRYEYEMVSLAWLCRRRTPIAQLPIQTVYLDGNSGSHFRPVRDSLRVYHALLRFYGAVLLHGRSVRHADHQCLRPA